MKINNILVLLCIGVIAVITSSCVDDVDIRNQMDENQKLVLYARLCPQIDTTYIMLSNTQLLYSEHGGEIRNIEDGVVELSSDGNTWVKASYNKERQRYMITKSELQINEGGTYYIRASYDGFEDVKATCTVPVSHDVAFRFDTVSTTSDVHWGEIFNWPHKDVYVQWNDVSGEENAYAIAQSVWSSQHGYPSEEGNEGNYWKLYVTWLADGNNDVQYVSDKGHDGEVMRYLFDYDIDDEEWKDDTDHATKYYLLFLDKGCYLYETTLSDDSYMNFLLLEPPHTYTNIENGYGLFGAYTMMEVYK